jgi:HAD superfamily hydrolase (TIGR01509 family)
VSLRALLWDVDGTLAETERDGHRVAFNRAFHALGLPWDWSEQRYGELLRVAGGLERLQHDLATQPAAPSDPAERAALAARIHRLKNDYYAQQVAATGLPLRPGVLELFADCAAAGVRMAIATTTSGANVAALLHGALGAGWRGRFAAVVCAEEAPRKKPDPQVYRLALDTLALRAGQALALEDSPAGAAAACAAGVPVVVTRSAYFAATAVTGMLAAGPSLGSVGGWEPAAAQAAGRVDLAQLVRWHARGS